MAKKMVTVTGGQKLQKFFANAKKAKSTSVDIGFFATSKYPPIKTGLGQRGDPQTPHYVATVALWQEFGTRTNTPERPFFRNAIQGAEAWIMPILKAELDPTTLHVGPDTAGRIGAVMQGKIQRSITELRDPPNAPATIHGGPVRTKTGKIIRIRGKGSSNPLIDTGTMRQAVTWRIRD